MSRAYVADWNSEDKKTAKTLRPDDGLQVQIEKVNDVLDEWERTKREHRLGDS